MSRPVDPRPFAVLSGDVTLYGDLWSLPSPRGTAVLLHGGAQTRGSWRRTAQRVAAAGWAAATVDLRGHGDSDWSPQARYDTDDLLGDLGAVLEHLRAEPGSPGPAVLVGASLGGLIALLHEGERPHPDAPAAGLVLVDVAVHLDPAGVRRVMDFMAAHADGFATVEEAVAVVAAYDPGRRRPPSAAGLRRNLRWRDDGRWHWHWDPRFLPDPPRRRTSEERVAAAAARLGTAQVPLLLVRGTRSDVVTEQVADDLLTMVPHAEVLPVPAGHMVAGDDNDAFATGLLDFLARTADGRVRGTSRGVGAD